MAEHQTDSDLFENRYIMNWDEALFIIRKFFSEQLSKFHKVKEYHNKAGYWGIKFSDDNIDISIDSDRGDLVTKISLLGGEDKWLGEFEPLMSNIKAASEKNIRFTLSVLQRFIKQAEIS